MATDYVERFRQKKKAGPYEGIPRSETFLVGEDFK